MVGYLFTLNIFSWQDASNCKTFVIIREAIMQCPFHNRAHFLRASRLGGWTTKAAVVCAIGKFFVFQILTMAHRLTNGLILGAIIRFEKPHNRGYFYSDYSAVFAAHV